MSDNENDQRKNMRKTGVGQSTPDELGLAASTTASLDAVAPGSRENTPSGDTDASAASANQADSQSIAERDMQYMITPRRKPAFAMMGLAYDFPQVPPSMEKIHDALQAMSNVTVVRRVRSNGLALMGSGPDTGSQDILVVRAKAGDTRLLSTLAHPGLIVERDYLLGHLADASPRPAQKIGLRPMTVIATSTTLAMHVQDSTGAPQAKCAIVLYTNAGLDVQGTSDVNGNASLVVPAGGANEIAAIYVKPFANCWEHFSYRPSLTPGAVNVVVLKRLSEFAAAQFKDPSPGVGGFSGWGQRLMGLTQVAPGHLTGRGIKVAIIDSGCDNTHPALTHVCTGQDYTNLSASHFPDPATWTNDTMSHGTHCAGVITGNGKDGHIRGFVPEAETHILKLFPGGAFNNLAAALHYCIDNQIDVVNCSLGGDQSSEAIEQLIDTARQAGIALIVAAGNSGAGVQFPGSVSGVMCVAAIGEQGDFPENTYHAQTCVPGTVGADGLFAASFSCRGPQIALCAPGVAVISSVPGGGYAAWDGTSMAAPAVTGLLAMVLAHHPEFAGRPVVRNAERVDRLFQLVARAAAPLAMSKQQVGAGLPLVSSGATRATVGSAAAPMQGIGLGATQISQAQLENIIRDAFFNSFGVNSAQRPSAP